MADVFISYSRRDTEFVNRLQEALEARSRSVWVDVGGIRAGELFPATLRAAIEECDAFVFVLSPDSLASAYCATEMQHAEKMEKRILPLLVRAPGDVPVLAAVRDRNWIMFGPDRDFDAAVGELAAALDTDLDHVRSHTRLLVKALEWDTAGQDRNRLLRGAELDGAEAWLARAGAATEPQPTELHRAFVTASRAAATRRTRTFAAVSTAVALVALVLLVVALVSRREAVDQRRHAQAVALTAIAGRLGVESQTDDSLDHATLLARQAVALEDSVTTRGDLLGVLTRAPQAIGLLKGAGNKHQTMLLRARREPAVARWRRQGRGPRPHRSRRAAGRPGAHGRGFADRSDAVLPRRPPAGFGAGGWHRGRARRPDVGATQDPHRAATPRDPRSRLLARRDAAGGQLRLR